MAVIMLDGHGKPGKLAAEYRKCLERMLWNEFGELAQLTSMRRTNPDDPVVLGDADSGDSWFLSDVSTVVDESDQRQDDAGDNPGT